jgi:DNA-directed RNA polymerase subunit RPC12/RpoP
MLISGYLEIPAGYHRNGFCIISCSAARCEAKMPVRFRCTECRALLSIASRKAGATVQCPRCRTAVTVPGSVESATSAESTDFGLDVESPTDKDWQREPPPVPNQPPAWATPATDWMPDPPAEPARGDPKPEGDPEEGDRPTYSRLPPINFAEAFVWWQRRFHGRTFPFNCPGCGTTIQLRQRVTQTRRTCPGCGHRIDVAGIDRQLKAMEPERQRLMHLGCGCGATAVLLALACTCAALVVVWCV